jgi:hypothetical protein
MKVDFIEYISRAALQTMGVRPLAPAEHLAVDLAPLLAGVVTGADRFTLAVTPGLRVAWRQWQQEVTSYGRPAVDRLEAREQPLAQHRGQGRVNRYLANVEPRRIRRTRGG